MKESRTSIQINPKDNVAVALTNLMAGSEISIENICVTLKQDVPQGHKFAIKTIGKESLVTKYGHSIGIALDEISAGEWVHTHNVKTTLKEKCEYSYSPLQYHQLSTAKTSSFMGFKRANGKTGTRNEIWIIPTVGCVNSLAELTERKSKNYIKGSIDDIVSYPHPYGCSQTGDDQEYTRKVLAGLIQHPNAGGVLVIGLGCENTGIEELKKYLDEYNPERVRFLKIQDSDNEIKEASKLVQELIDCAHTDEREEVSTENLIVGLKCGASDGLSGLTANPLVGTFSDKLIDAGGSTILTEVPEMFGAETVLMGRCMNKTVFSDTVKLINDFKDYYINQGQEIYENPSPGNKDGGITTLEDKSLGCTQKSGTAPVSGVVQYGEQISNSGLNLLSAPGNDIVSTTALTIAGAQLILFTTGRGTPLGAPVPTIKISSNTELYKRKPHWIDFDAGSISADGDRDKLAQDLFSYVLNIASGKKVNAELSGYRDMAIFKRGVTL